MADSNATTQDAAPIAPADQPVKSPKTGKDAPLASGVAAGDSPSPTTDATSTAAPLGAAAVDKIQSDIAKGVSEPNAPLPADAQVAGGSKAALDAKSSVDEDGKTWFKTGRTIGGGPTGSGFKKWDNASGKLVLLGGLQEEYASFSDKVSVAGITGPGDVAHLLTVTPSDDYDLKYLDVGPADGAPTTLAAPVAGTVDVKQPAADAKAPEPATIPVKIVN